MRGRMLMLAAGQKRGQQQAQQQVAQAAASATEDVIAQIEKLSALHQSGALTDEEFAAAKKKLLG